MKKLNQIIWIIAAVLLVPQFLSCRRIMDGLIRNSATIVNGCGIHQIQEYDHRGDIRTISFNYNRYGNPVSILNDKEETGAPQIYFRYDASQRLTDYIRVYDNINGIDNWRKFYYDERERIIRDTTWVFGEFGEIPDPDSYLIAETFYTYDVFDRMIREEIVQFYPEAAPPIIYNYVYSADGNKISPSAEYDDKINILRTHKLWLFLERNYSANNLKPALSYNSRGLPLEFNTSPGMHFLNFSLNNSSIEYLCP